MFRSIGFVIALYAVITFFSNAANSFEAAIVATFDTLEAAAIVSQEELIKLH